MIYKDPNAKKPPDAIRLGKAKTMAVVILPGGIRVERNTKVKYWIEREGFKEEYFILHDDKVHDVTPLEFKRRFKVMRRGYVIEKKSLK